LPSREAFSREGNSKLLVSQSGEFRSVVLCADRGMALTKLE